LKLVAAVEECITTDKLVEVWEDGAEAMLLGLAIFLEEV
jgi:hypothetical protein